MRWRRCRRYRVRPQRGVSGVSWASGHEEGCALDFGGAAAGLDLGTFDPFEDDLTLATWVFCGARMDCTRPLPGTRFVVRHRMRWHFVRNKVGRLQFSRAGGVRVPSTDIPAIDAWSHLAVTKTGDAITLYLNGTAVSTRSMTLGPDTEARISGRNIPEGGHPFNGLIDDLRFYGRALSGAEILQLFTDTSGGASRGAGPATISTPLVGARPPCRCRHARERCTSFSKPPRSGPATPSGRVSARPYPATAPCSTSRSR